MTKEKLRKRTIYVIAIYLNAIVLGILLRLFGPEKNIYYETFKDLIPFILATPAAYLGYCFQQRVSYLKSLRSLWTNLIKSVHNAIQYTHLEEPSNELFGTVLSDLSLVIDEVRGVYKNIGERPGEIGLYPYEPIKSIYEEIEKLGYGKIEDRKRKKGRNNIRGHWKSIREEFLSEFDRHEPSKVVSPYIEE